MATPDPRADEEFWKGDALRRAGRFDEAVAQYVRAIQLKPDHVPARNHLAGLLRARGDVRAAAEQLRVAAAADPRDADTLNNLGTVERDLGRAAEALACYERALALNPQHAQAHNNRGNALLNAKRVTDAITAYQAAVRAAPDFAEAHFNLSRAWKAFGRADHALVAIDGALKLAPTDAKLHFHRGTALLDLGRQEDAARAYRESVNCDPKLLEARLHVAMVLSQLGRMEEALSVHRNAVRACPDNPQAHFALAFALKDHVELEESVREYTEVVRLDRRPRAIAAARHERATLLPPIYRSHEDVAEWRTRFETGVRQLVTDDVRLDVTQVPAAPVFGLAYQGRQDRALMEALATRIVPPPQRRLARARGGPGPLRIGIISAHFFNHTISNLFRGLIKKISRKEFQVTVLSFGEHTDEMGRFIRAAADRYVALPRDVAAAREIVAAQDLDLLLYTDIGMEPYTYSLAFSRLAPVQAVGVGHPLTTDIPTIDYFITADLTETEEADAHYSEKLVRLDATYTYYFRPPVPPQHKTRAQLGLPERPRIYGCPQTLFKLHPDFDAVVGGVLRRDPQGVLLLIRSKFRAWERVLLDRFRRTMPDVVDRVILREAVPIGDFLSFMHHCEVMLDPMHYSGGNSSIEAMAVGTPVVTLPSPYNRGRHTYAFYKRMGVMDTVATSPEDYVEKAVRMGTDPDARKAVVAKIREAAPVLYESRACVEAWERFFREAVARARGVA